MAAHARVRTRPAPRHARRISGPVVRPRPVPAGAPPLRRGTTGVFERIRAHDQDAAAAQHRERAGDRRRRCQ